MEMNYLPLTEYSTKYKVSISTLRRKIKANDIEYRFDQGKYFILDETAKSPSLKTSPSRTANEGNFVRKTMFNSNAADSMSEKDFLTSSAGYPSFRAEEPILTAANRLLSELKKAYSQILQEKEEQLLNLKEEVTDLKTLVRVLEAENDRLKIRPQF